MNNIAEILDTVIEPTEIGTEVGRIDKTHPKAYSDEGGQTIAYIPSKDGGSSGVSFYDVERIKTPPVRKPIDRETPFFRTMTKWVGEVIEVHEYSFLARVYEEKNNGASGVYDDYVDFNFAEVNDSDREFIKDGAIFDWHIGQRFKPYRQMENTSIIIFRRMPVWRNYLEKAEEKAKEFTNMMGWSDST
ncbi:hypothetical protein MYX76_05330 [Desulfobacterota bacterium AH_259_B03_O07]|nr:hypothetical protein [Desulfobacterota bacterium AH_259_B03_O07]